MAIGSINSEIRSLIASKLQEKGIDLYEIEYKKEPDGQVIRIYIDTLEGVDVGICARATRAVKEYIDTESNLYYDYLEVSSPGIDRILKTDSDYERFQGERVLVKTSQLVEGQKKFVGILANTNQDILSIEIEGNLMQISRDAISIVRLHPDI
ncbi:MAG: ribosome maturation factor RimP [Firmicutes bacterium HGW-Firmicutes-15]|nr:MAG: ribosome maturation factor RimP [Firmicutes bacterium HGW-Firmicutes-15]